MQTARLTHPDIDFWIDVRLRDFDGRWLVVADLAGAPDVGVGETVDEALRLALSSLGEGLAEELAARFVALGNGGTRGAA